MKISTQSLEFPECIKEKLLKMINVSKVDIEFVNGNNIIFEKTNLALEEPHKIIVKQDNTNIIILYYEREDNFYIDDLQTPIPFTKLINIINNLIN